MAAPSPKAQGELARTRTVESNEDWPDRIEVSAHFGKRRVSIEITGDQFFGRGGYGAPISGEQLIGMIERLRRGRAA